MSLVNSPKVEYAADGKPPERGAARRLVLRVALIVLLATAVGINVYVWIQGNVVNRLAGSDGVVQGQVLLPDGKPLANAEVFLDAAPQVIARTDADGYFVLKNIPTGEQTLLVGFEDRAVELELVVGQGSPTELGPIMYETPIGDDYWK